MCLVLGSAFEEAAVNDLMPSSGASNLNTLTPQSANCQESFCSNQELQARGSPGYSTPRLGLRQDEAPLTSHSRCHEGRLAERVDSPHPISLATQPEPLATSGFRPCIGSPRVLCDSSALFKTRVTHAVRFFLSKKIK